MDLNHFKWYYSCIYNLVYFPPILQLLKNELGEEGFQYDVQTLARVSDIDIFPDTYVSYSNTFSFYLVTNGCGGPEKFRARVKKGK